MVPEQLGLSTDERSSSEMIFGIIPALPGKFFF